MIPLIPLSQKVVYFIYMTKIKSQTTSMVHVYALVGSVCVSCCVVCVCWGGGGVGGGGGQICYYVRYDDTPA